jgi:hypothetical protein
VSSLQFLSSFSGISSCPVVAFGEETLTCEGQPIVAFGEEALTCECRPIVAFGEETLTCEGQPIVAFGEEALTYECQPVVSLMVKRLFLCTNADYNYYSICLLSVLKDVGSHNNFIHALAL